MDKPSQTVASNRQAPCHRIDRHIINSTSNPQGKQPGRACPFLFCRDRQQHPCRREGHGCATVHQQATPVCFIPLLCMASYFYVWCGAWVGMFITMPMIIWFVGARVRWKPPLEIVHLAVLWHRSLVFLNVVHACVSDGRHLESWFLANEYYMHMLI